METYDQENLQVQDSTEELELMNISITATSSLICENQGDDNEEIVLCEHIL